MNAERAYEGKKRLYKPKSLVMRRIDDFYLALNPDVPNIMVMDEIGKRFFELCDGTLTEDEIVETILREKKGEVSKEELAGFIAVMRNAKFLFLKTPPTPQKTGRNLDKLRRLYLHITRACNQSCKHCYLEAGYSLKNEITIAEALKLVGEFAQLGGQQLIITGGEPLLRRKMLYEVIKKAREAKIGGIFVETNGTLVSNEDVDFFKKYEVVIGVSLDGAVKESHDYIRGAGNFEKTICTIKKLVDERIKVRISATLMKSNLKDVEKIIYLAKDLGADSTSFNVVKKIGKAEAHTELLLSPEEAYSAVSTVWKTAKEVGVPTYLEDRFKMLEELTRADMCGVGTALLAVSSDGDVYPCNMLFEFEEFKAGNIREQHLEEIWRKSEAAKIFTNLSVLDIEGCGNCELKFICAICPVEIYKEYGSFNKKPSFCSFYKGTCWILIEELARKMWSEQ